MTRSEEWSKSLFNNAHLLRVAAEIGKVSGDVQSLDLQSRLALGQSTVYRVLRTLEEVGLLKRLDRSSRTDPLCYRRVPHSFWTAARQLERASGTQLS